MRFGAAILTFLGDLAAAVDLPAACPPDVEAALLAADRNFAADAKQAGLPGWLRHFARGARALTPDDREINGEAGITQYYSELFPNPESIPRWSPMRADCAKDESLGFTYGTWNSQAANGPGGQYITVWRKQKDGHWKVIFDLGNLRPPRR